MAQIGLTEAARLAGRNQSTIHRAMQTGRLSYSTNSAGKRVVDTAEIDRVFGIKTVAPHDGFNGAISASEARIGNGVGHAHAAKSHVTHEPESVLVIAAQAETIAQQDATIADLRARLDVEAAERRQLSERLTAILTDQREREAGTDLPFAVQMDHLPVKTRGNQHPVSNDIGPNGPSAAAGLAIPRRPWWRRWFR